jgi:hypothetical protein
MWWYDELLVSEIAEIAVSCVDGKHSRTAATRVGNAFEQRCRWIVRSDNHHRFSASSVFESRQPDCKMRRCLGWR